MILEPVPVYRPGHVEFKLATEPWELRGYLQLRTRIFCDEQQLFDLTDVDAIDRRAYPIVAVVHTSGMPDRIGGVVRIYQDLDEPGVWLGGRLGTDPSLRAAGAIGTGLVRRAVSTARAWGCWRFLAYVQCANERFFQQLHWRTLKQVDYHGVPHVFMEAELDHYPPLPSPGPHPVHAAA